MNPAAPITGLGRLVINFIHYLGGVATLVWEVMTAMVRGRWRWRIFMEQMMEIGVRSQPVVIVTGAFTGAVLTAQSLYQFQVVKMESAAGSLTGVAMLRELGPMVTGLMLAGRIGSAMAAEIGTMKVTEQIDALRSMNVHPVDYLVLPRVAGMALSIPLLAMEAAFFGMLASYIVAVIAFGVGEAYFFDQMKRYLDHTDFIMAVTKSMCFGLLIVIVSCHQGLATKNGAVGVGKATTQAMVYSSLFLLVVNFFLTLVLSVIFPTGIGK